MNGINFLGKHSYRDFGLTINSRSFTNPSKKKIKETVPFARSSYDFSAIYGENQYSERTLTYVFNIVKHTRESMLAMEEVVTNWLMSSLSKSRLEDDYYPANYFMAEVENETSLSFNWSDGLLTVTFVAYSFKISKYLYGSDVWDFFNFERDYAGENEFTITDTATITLHNASIIRVIPKVVVTSTMIVKKNNQRFTFEEGEHMNYAFTLEPGENTIEVSGVGTIKFEYHTEVI